MRESNELTRKQLISIIEVLRDNILDDGGPYHTQLYRETAFDVSPEDDPGDDRSWMPLTKEEKRQYCSGCHNDDYNRGLGGAKECWSLEDAKRVMAKFVHMNHVPPWEHEAEETLNCHHKDRFIKVDPERTC